MCAKRWAALVLCPSGICLIDHSDKRWPGSSKTIVRVSYLVACIQATSTARCSLWIGRRRCCYVLQDALDNIS